MKSQHLDLLNEAATALMTHSWENTKKKDHGDSVVQILLYHFKTPLKHAGADIAILVDEWHALRDYGRNYLNLVENNYQTAILNCKLQNFHICRIFACLIQLCHTFEFLVFVCNNSFRHLSMEPYDVADSKRLCNPQYSNLDVDYYSVNLTVHNQF